MAGVCVRCGCVGADRCVRSCAHVYARVHCGVRVCAGTCVRMHACTLCMLVPNKGTRLCGHMHVEMRVSADQLPEGVQFLLTCTLHLVLPVLLNILQEDVPKCHHLHPCFLCCLYRATHTLLIIFIGAGKRQLYLGGGEEG